MSDMHNARTKPPSQDKRDAVHLGRSKTAAFDEADLGEDIGDTVSSSVHTAPAYSVAASPRDIARKEAIRLLSHLPEETQKLIHARPASRRIVESLAGVLELHAAAGRRLSAEGDKELMVTKLDAIHQKLEAFRAKTDESKPATAEEGSQRLESKPGQRGASGVGSADSADGADFENDPTAALSFSERADANLNTDETLARLDFVSATMETPAHDDVVGQSILAQQRRAMEEQLRVAAVAPERAKKIIDHAKRNALEKVEAALHAGFADDETTVVIELAWEEKGKRGDSRHRALRSARFELSSNVQFPGFSRNYLTEDARAALLTWAQNGTVHGKQQMADLVGVLDAIGPDVIWALHPFLLTNELLRVCYNGAFANPGDAETAYAKFVLRTDAEDRERGLNVSCLLTTLVGVQKYFPDTPSMSIDGTSATDLFAWAGALATDFSAAHPGRTALAILNLRAKLSRRWHEIAVRLKSR